MSKIELPWVRGTTLTKLWDIDIYELHDLIWRYDLPVYERPGGLPVTEIEEIWTSHGYDEKTGEELPPDCLGPNCLGKLELYIRKPVGEAHDVLYELWFKREDILCFQEKYSVNRPSNATSGHKVGLESRGMVATKMRPNQRHKLACRRVAEEIWREDKTITITEMAYRDDINDLFEGITYSEKTIRNWIKDLCPNRKPGRRPRKK